MSECPNCGGNREDPSHNSFTCSRLNETIMQAGMEAITSTERHLLALSVIEALEQAKKTIAVVGHKTTCGFSGCTCGAVEIFKIESAKFWRMIQKLK